MNKQEFLNDLRQRLNGQPPADIEKYIQYYSEMLDDRIEEGMSEEEAVANLSLPEELADQSAVPPVKPRRKLAAWELVLLILGAPIWCSLLIAAVSVACSLYVVLWSVVIVLFAALISLWACSFAGVVMGVVGICKANTAACITCLGMGLFCAGLALFMNQLCILSVKAMLWLTKAVFNWVKSLFVRKEVAG